MPLTGPSLRVPLDPPALEVEFGLDQHGAVVKPDDHYDDGELFCPACGEPLYARAGWGHPIRRHFVHKRKSECSGESLLHRTAKGELAQALLAARDGGKLVRIVGKCCYTRCSNAWEEPYRPISESEVCEEFPLRGRRADVAVVIHHSGCPRAVASVVHRGALVCCVAEAQVVVEIRQTHSVDAEKLLDLGSVGCIELEARDVIEEPLRWRPLANAVQTWPRPRACCSCAAREAQCLPAPGFLRDSLAPPSFFSQSSFATRPDPAQYRARSPSLRGVFERCDTRKRGR